MLFLKGKNNKRIALKAGYRLVKYALPLTALVSFALVFSSCDLLNNAGKGDSQPETAAETAGVTSAPATVAPTTEAPTEEPTTLPPLNGFVEEDGMTYYYIDGVPQTDTVVGDDEEGYYYVGDDGAIDYGYCDGVNIDGTDWIIIEGEAFTVQTESDECLLAAAKDVAKCTYSGMSREEKLKACFDYIKTNYLEGVRHNPPYSYTEPDWPVVYANDIFVYGKGDCYSFGAAYAYMARAIGYTESYACNSGGHGWAEVENRTYDPEWSMHSKKYSYYAMSYDEECDVHYGSAISSYTEQKRRQIVLHG